MAQIRSAYPLIQSLSEYQSQYPNLIWINPNSQLADSQFSFKRVANKIICIDADETLFTEPEYLDQGSSSLIYEISGYLTGAVEFLQWVSSQKLYAVILTAGKINRILDFMESQGNDLDLLDAISNVKIPGFYIDDRAFQFTGDFSAAKEFITSAMVH